MDAVEGREEGGRGKEKKEGRKERRKEKERGNDERPHTEVVVRLVNVVVRAREGEADLVVVGGVLRADVQTLLQQAHLLGEVTRVVCAGVDVLDRRCGPVRGVRRRAPYSIGVSGGSPKKIEHVKNFFVRFYLLGRTPATPAHRATTQGTAPAQRDSEPLTAHSTITPR